MNELNLNNRIYLICLLGHLNNRIYSNIGPYISSTNLILTMGCMEDEKTRFGPNKPAADMEGNGEFDF